MNISIEHDIELPMMQAGTRCTARALLSPRDLSTQKIGAWEIGGSAFSDATPIVDAFGNLSHLVTFFAGDTASALKIKGEVTTTDRDAIVGRIPNEPTPVLFKRMTAETPSTQFTYGVARGLRASEESTLECLHQALARVHERATSTPQDGEADLEPADNVHAFLAICRTIGVPARFVSGYVANETETQMHAWAEAWDDNLGWIGFDPTLGLCPSDAHVGVAVGLDATTTNPLRLQPIPGEDSKISMAIHIGQ